MRQLPTEWASLCDRIDRDLEQWTLGLPHFPIQLPDERRPKRPVAHAASALRLMTLWNPAGASEPVGIMDAVHGLIVALRTQELSALADQIEREFGAVVEAAKKIDKFCNSLRRPIWVEDYGMSLAPNDIDGGTLLNQVLPECKAAIDKFSQTLAWLHLPIVQPAARNSRSSGSSGAAHGKKDDGKIKSSRKNASGASSGECASCSATTRRVSTAASKMSVVRMEPGCRRLCAELREEAGSLDVSPPPLDAPLPQQYSWMEATAALLADAYGLRLDRAGRFREQLFRVKYASRSRGLAPDDKREQQWMANGLAEVLMLAESAVSDAEKWRSDLWERVKGFMPSVARDMQVVCVGVGHLDSSQLSKAVDEWRRIEVVAAEKRAAARQKKWNLRPGTWTAAERAAWRPPERSSQSQEREDTAMNQMDRHSLSADDEAAAFEKCRRRCCICYALENNDSQQDGQLAHLDHDHSNGNPDNFVFLCLRHHNIYDSKMRQAKNMTEREVRRYRTMLHEAVDNGEVPSRQGLAILKFPVQQPEPVNVNGDNNIVATGNVNYTVNMARPRRGKARVAIRPPIIPGTVSEDARMVGYLNYLVQRYEKFKKWECDKNGRRMGYGVIRNAYKRDMKYELIHTPTERFAAGARYLQERIEGTRLGRMKRGQKLYSTFQCFDELAGENEALPV